MTCDTLQRIDGSVDLIESCFNPLLLPAESIVHIRRVARMLPVGAVDFFGFECRLGPEIAPADCAFNLTPEGAKMLAGRDEAAPPEELQYGVWERIREFYSLWADTAETPYADAGSTWFEFDVSSGDPSPNMLFGYWPGRSRSRTPAWLIDTIIPLLLASPISPEFRRNFLHCFETLPAGTSDFQIGVMLSRGIAAVRLCVFDLPQGQVFPWLDRVGWNGPREELRQYMDALRPHADFLGLHLDVGEQVYPHIGIEPNFTAGCWSRQPHREQRWHGQFQQLIELGVMTPEKRQALLSWIGHKSIVSGGRDTLLLRGLSHLKVVLRPGRPAIAKGYFGIAHRVLGEV
jgi:hypothetical protein